MSVYVDTMRAPYGRMVMCHMIADSTDELLAMARSIGVDVKWIQNAGTHLEHFDIALSKRAMALKAGAIEVTKKELVYKLRERRKTTPEGLCTRCSIEPCAEHAYNARLPR